MTVLNQNVEQTASEISVAARIRTVCVCLGYITVSASLIRFNKWMMQPGHFPHSSALSAIHMMVTLAMCSCTYMIAPSMFVSMSTVTENRAEFFKWFLPIGACFAMML